MRKPAAHQVAATEELFEWWEDLHDRSIGSQLLCLRVPSGWGRSMVLDEVAERVGSDSSRQGCTMHADDRASCAVFSTVVRTIVLGANPDIEAVIARRRSLGQDLFDEVWGGEYHMAPAGTGAHALLQIRLPHLLHPFAATAGLIASGPFNLGQLDDFRVPDVGYHRTKPVGVWHATAAIVVEIVSPDDETYAKFDFYLAHGVEEIIVADPAERSVRCFLRTGASFASSERSVLLGVDAAYMTAEIDWP